MTQDTVEKYARELEPICKQADEYQKGHGYPVGTPAIELVKHVLKEVEKTVREEGARAERAKVVEWAEDEWDVDKAANDPTNDFIAHDAYESKADAFYHGYNQALIDLKDHLSDK